jgi:hypothetical protein
VAHGPVERAKAAIFGAEVRVVDIPVDYVSDYTLRVQLAANRIRSHADADEVVACKQIERFLTCHHTELSGYQKLEGRIQSALDQQRGQAVIPDW